MHKLTLVLSTAALAVSGAAFAQPATGMRPMPQGDVTRAHAQQRAEQMFARMDANKDGTLNEADRAAMKAKMFDRLDANHDGQVTKAEMTAAHSAREGKWEGRKGKRAADRPAMTDAQKAERHDAHFAKIDTDGNGAISRAEFDAMKGMHGGRMGKRGGHHGMMAKAGGPVTEQAFVARALTRFDRADANKDGTVTQAERKAAVDAMKANWRTEHPARQQG
jgi:Ca2+-binding EF-hand superfamily protein